MAVIRFTTALSTELKDRLTKFAKDRGITSRAAIQEAVLRLLGDDPSPIAPGKKGAARQELQIIKNANGCERVLFPIGKNVKYRLPGDSKPKSRTLPRYVFELNKGRLEEGKRVICDKGTKNCVCVEHLIAI